MNVEIFCSLIMGIIISKKSSENNSSSASVTSSTRPSSIVRSQSENDKMVGDFKTIFIRIFFYFVFDLVS